MQDTAGEVRAISQAIFSNEPLHTDVQVLNDQLELIYSSSVIVKTLQKRWMEGERERERERE